MSSSQKKHKQNETTANQNAGTPESANDNTPINPTAERMQTFRLKTVVVICGSALMALEMAGVRILEPYFGSTIYVWGSIIGIFLGSLSLGYWLGGLVADRAPNLRVLGWLILASAFLVFLIPPTASPLGNLLIKTPALGPRLQAFLGSLALYALPSALLGMVSPFAVRLSLQQLHQAGRVAGSLYALGTLGSILGTFLTTFVLTDLIGTTAIVWGIGAVLAAVALLCLWSKGLKQAVTVAAAVVMVGLGWWGQIHAEEMIRHDALFDESGQWGDPDRHLETIESAYHRISVIESKYNLETRRPDTNWCRYMLFNNQVESGAVCASAYHDSPAADQSATATQENPAETACGYVRLLHTGVILTGEKPKNVLVIGCGGGIGPQAFYQDYGCSRIDVVDIDPQVFHLAEKYFSFPENGTHPAIVSHIADGRLILSQGTGQDWDYVILDAYTAGGRIPKHLISQEFFELVKKRMAPGGVIVANIISALDGEKSRLYRSVATTMGSVFGEVVTFPRFEKGETSENLMLACRLGKLPQTPAEIRTAFANLSGTLIKQPGLQQAVSAVRTGIPTGGVLLTDNYCPVDSMVTQ